MVILVTAIAFAAAQTAADRVPAGSERRLTPEQVEAVLAEAAAKREASQKRPPATVEIEDLEPMRPPVRGEFGVGMGTGGYREIFGSSVIPMGRNGGAAFSFDVTDFGDNRYPRDRY